MQRVKDAKTELAINWLKIPRGLLYTISRQTLKNHTTTWKGTWCFIDCIIKHKPKIVDADPCPTPPPKKKKNTKKTNNNKQNKQQKTSTTLISQQIFIPQKTCILLTPLSSKKKKKKKNYNNNIKIDQDDVNI